MVKPNRNFAAVELNGGVGNLEKSGRGANFDLRAFHDEFLRMAPCR